MSSVLKTRLDGDRDFQGGSHVRPFPVVALNVEGDFSNEDNNKLHSYLALFYFILSSTALFFFNN